MNSFFFSSRRRHTRWTGDWSSDVCSSDLYATAADVAERLAAVGRDGRVAARRVDRVDPLHLRVAALNRSEERRVGKEGRLRRAGDRGKNKRGGRDGRGRGGRGRGGERLAR